MSKISLEATPALAEAGKPFGDPSTAGVIVESRAPCMAIILAARGQQKALADSVRARFGLSLPAGPACVAAGALTLVGIGPGRWLAVIEEENAPSPTELSGELAGLASVSDQTSGFALLRVGGPRVRAALAKGVPIDLHESAFGPGAAAVTSVSHIGVTIWRIDAAPSYDMAVFRSFAGSFWYWLTESAAEFGLATRR